MGVESRDGDGLEGGWRLQGVDGANRPVSITVGETELGRAYLGVSVGRHPKLCEVLLDDPTISRRHFRLGLAAGGPFIEDVHSLNGTRVDGDALSPFRPVALRQGQRITAGRVSLVVMRLPGGPDGGKTEP